jgi:HEAT repeat protein
MPLRFEWILALAAILAPAPQSKPQPEKPQAASPQDKPQIAWETSYESALERAKKENKPLFVAFIMDDEVANDETCQQHYRDPDIVALSAKMVCVIGNVGTHAASGPCPKFGAITCEQHKKSEIKARNAICKTDVLRAPQHIFCAPTGVELFRKVYIISKDEMMKAMSVAISAQAKGGALPDLATAERARVDKLLKEIDGHNADARDAAFKELATADDARAIPAVLAKAKPGTDDNVRISAILALGVKGNHAAIKPLLGIIKGGGSSLTVAALTALEAIELPDPTAEILALYKKEQNERVKGHALRALAHDLPEGGEVQKVCIAALSGTSNQSTATALLAIAALKPDPKITAALKPLLETKNQSIRALAILDCGKQHDKSLVPILEKMGKEEKVPELRDLAVKAAAYSGGAKIDEFEGFYKTYYADFDR